MGQSPVPGSAAAVRGVNEDAVSNIEMNAKNATITAIVLVWVALCMALD